jgi:transcription antitermination protein NusB
MTGAQVGRNHIDRSRSRAWALQILYRWETSNDGVDLSRSLVEVQGTRRIGPQRLDYIRRILDGLDQHLASLDEEVAASLHNWRLDRLSILDRGILRIAALEMLHFEDVPPKVSIQEAVRLAERWGGKDSPRFVNGVLDALLHKADVKG